MFDRFCQQGCLAVTRTAKNHVPLYSVAEGCKLRRTATTIRFDACEDLSNCVSTSAVRLHKFAALRSLLTHLTPHQRMLSFSFDRFRSMGQPARSNSVEDPIRVGRSVEYHVNVCTVGLKLSGMCRVIQAYATWSSQLCGQSLASRRI